MQNDTIKKYCLKTVDEVNSLSSEEIISYYKSYYNPGMLIYYKFLGFDKIIPVKAEGMYIYLKNNKKILDCTGGVGILNIGHNHPRILEIRKKINEEKKMEFCKAFLSPYLAVLAKNISEIFPGDLNYSFFCNSGSEAIEGALKTAEKFQGKNKNYILYSDKSFHGKTHAAMSVSYLDDSKKYFKQLDGCISFKYNDINDLEDIIIRYKNKICAIVLEAIHGTRVIIPDNGYLKSVRSLCDKYGIILIIDEIYTGFGRTGKMFAFEYENIIPDIVCFSKSVGGGKASIGGFVMKKNIFNKTWGGPKDSMIHSTTFSGMTEECATAIEALNIINDENLAYNSEIMGNYFKEQLLSLKNEFPEIIKEIRGRGLLLAVEFNNEFSKFKSILNTVILKTGFSLAELFSALIITEFFHEYNILAYLSYSRRDILVFSPSLIITKNEIDYIINSFKSILKNNLSTLSIKTFYRLLQKNN